MVEQPYSEDLAYIHHVGFADFARGAAPAVLDALRSSGSGQGLVVELGCGSGVLLSTLARSGYRTLGIDRSPFMLEIARGVSPSSELIEGSLYEAPFPACAAVVALGEPLNYVVSPNEVPPTAGLFSRVAASLSQGAPFLFDVMVDEPVSLAARRSWRSGDDWAVLVDVQSTRSRRTLRRAITTFRLVGELYRRGHEDHLVHLFSVADLTAQLQAAGFSVQTARSYGSMPLADGSLSFTCVRSSA